jgi:hypothetical protein
MGDVHADLAKAAAQSIKFHAEERAASWGTECVINVGMIEEPLLADGSRSCSSRLINLASGRDGYRTSSEDHRDCNARNTLSSALLSKTVARTFNGSLLIMNGRAVGQYH